MDKLLSVAFDNIASKDSQKIGKGLRQIEGMLAQICLSSGKSSTPSKPAHRRNASAINIGERDAREPEKLGALADDLAFREFFRIQEGFEFNVALRVADCLERLLGMHSDDSLDLLILSALSNLQGLLLLHPPSRSIFGRENYMNLLLDLLDPYNCPAIQSSALLVLVTALLSTPQNTRLFESMDGLLTITTLFKDEETTQQVKLKLLEFLYFYLMPEAPAPVASAPNTAMGLQRSPSKLASAFDRRSSTVSGDAPSGSDRSNIKSQHEKQHMLGRYLSNVDALVEDLQETAPFTSAAC